MFKGWVMFVILQITIMICFLNSLHLVIYLIYLALMILIVDNDSCLMASYSI